MRRDCPHCGGDLGQRFIRWSKIQQTTFLRSCPMCGKEIEHWFHREEFVLRGLAIVVAIAVSGWINFRGGFLLPVIVGTAILVAAYVIVTKRLQDAQRYKKGRNEA